MHISKWKQLLVEYFSFSLREKWVMFFLILTGLLFTIAPRFLPAPRNEVVLSDSMVEKALRQFNDSGYIEETRDEHLNKQVPAPKAKRFFFDPNLASMSDWLQLGLQEKTARTILNYRSKGGRFRTAADLDKIYGLDAVTTAALKPFVRIGKPEKMPSSDLASQKIHGEVPDRSRVRLRERKIQSIDINEADSLAWLELPGIGPKLAGRILLFRSRLGGFYRIEQVREVYGLPDSVFQSVKASLRMGQEQIHPLNINTATEQELSRHPYIRHSLARAIVQYRSLHGPFSQVNELAKIHLMTPELAEKLMPYCKIE